jgi:hypothetical protein
LFFINASSSTKPQRNCLDKATAQREQTMKSFRILSQVSSLVIRVSFTFVVGANPVFSQTPFEQPDNSTPTDVALELDNKSTMQEQEPDPRALLADIENMRDPKAIYAGLLQLRTVTEAHIKWLQEHATYQPDDYHFALELEQALTPLNEAVSDEESETSLNCESYRSLLLNSYRAQTFDEVPEVFLSIYSLTKKICASHQE